MELMQRQPFEETPSSLQDLQWQPTIVPGNDKTESIIANTDFKVCSGLARRRLSSKKRKKPMEGGQEREHVATEMGASRSSHSPAEGRTPIRDSSYYQNSAHGSHRAPCFYQGAPTTISGGVLVPSEGQYVSMAQGFPLMSTPSIGMLTKQFSNPVLHQPNYRFIQDQRMFVPALVTALCNTETGGTQSSSPQHEQVQPCNHSGVKKPFKWCYAHVMVARQIHQHQMQIKASSEQSQAPHHHCAGQSNSAPLPQQEHHIQHLQHQQQHLQHQQQHIQLQHQLQHQHQQQQLLLLQMYGCLPRNGVVPGGYVTLPYAPSLQDLQLGYLPSQNISLAPSAVSLVKPAPVTTCVSATPELNAHLSGALQLAPTMASLAPVPELTNVFPGAPWIAPVPVFGSCIVNPFHPGVLATSWVK